MNYTNRSFKLELLDNPDIPTEDLYQNLRELDFINTYLGGHSITLKGLEILLVDKLKRYHIVDVGCGGGDTLKKMASWARGKKFQIRFTGVDMKADCLSYAKKNCEAYPEISFIESDYRDTRFSDADVVVSALFCHHLDNDLMVSFLRWQAENAKIGFVINDLHRNMWAYRSIELLTNVFSKSYLVKNDAKLSVLRGFSRSELLELFEKSKISEVAHFEVFWKWAFRWLVVGKIHKNIS